jgi:hypothetical protein
MLQSDQPLNVQQRAQLLSQGQGQPEQGRRGPDQQMEIERQQHREEREEEEPVALIGRKRKRLKKNKKLIANNMKKFNHEIETSINEQAKLVKEADKKIETPNNNLNLQKKELSYRGFHVFRQTSYNMYQRRMAGLPRGIQRITGQNSPRTRYL